jgi:KDO2-lipid IV(A) lauroyltransferase
VQRVTPARGAYFAYRAGAEVARALPEPIGAPMARGVARGVGLAFMRSRVRQVERNLRRVYGPGFGGAALRRAVAATFDSYGRYFYELFRLPGTPKQWIDAHTDITGAEHIAAAIAAGAGVVLALPHLGNWDFAGAWLAGQGYTVTVVAEPLEPPELFEWFVETRRRLGMRVIALSPSAGSEALAALRSNEALCLLCDRDLTGDGVAVEFLGERTTLPAGPATLALRSGAPLLPVGCYFGPDGRHRIHVLEPIETRRVGRIRDDVSRVTQELADRFADLIRAQPEHWHLLQPNWPSDREA